MGLCTFKVSLQEGKFEHFILLATLEPFSDRLKYNGSREMWRLG